MNPENFGWALIVFFTWPFGLIAYLLLRDQTVQL